jgi:hypothetical protein
VTQDDLASLNAESMDGAAFAELFSGASVVSF